MGEDRIEGTALLFIGSGAELSTYVGLVDGATIGRYRVVGLIAPRDDHRSTALGGHRVIGSIADLPLILPASVADRVVVLSNGIGEGDRLVIEEIAVRHSRAYVEVNLAPDLSPSRTTAALDHVSATPLRGG